MAPPDSLTFKTIDLDTKIVILSALVQNRYGQRQIFAKWWTMHVQTAEDIFFNLLKSLLLKSPCVTIWQGFAHS